MTYVPHRPPAPLRSYVAAAAGYRSGPSASGVHRGLPSRHVTLVLELAGPLRVALGRGVAAHGVVGGLHTTPALIDASRPQEGLQYDLTALGVHALLGLPAAALHGEVVDLTDVLGPPARDLVEQLQAARGWGERFRLLDAALLRRLGRVRAGAGSGPPPEVAEAWRVLWGSDGRTRVADVAGRVGWSRRHLSEQFRVHTGLTPKQAARVARFEAARRLLLSPVRPPLADVAARCHYADQPHLSREWRALAGCSLGTWLREELPYVHDSLASAGAGFPHDTDD